MFPKTKMVLPHNILKEIVQKHMTPNIDIYGPRSNKKVI
jgi:hypothetical protein